MRIVKLRDISDLKTGPFGTQFSASEYVSNGIPVINVKNIGYGSISAAGLDYVGENTLERLSEHKLKAGDIVFGRKGSVDRHCLICREQEGWMQGSDCIRVRFIDDSVYPEFVSYFLLTNAVKIKINNSAVGSTMASLNTGILGDIDITLPEYTEQKRIALILGEIDKKISKNNMVNDIIYARRGDVEKHAFVKDNSQMLCGTGCLRVRIMSEDIYPPYLSFYLNRPETKRWITSHAVGSNMPNLNTGILEAVPIEYPDYKSQVRIAAVLQKLEEKIDINNKINNHLLYIKGVLSEKLLLLRSNDADIC